MNTRNVVDALYKKTITCPICDLKFKSLAVRMGKYRVVSRDLDTMPRYTGMNPLFYDVCVCPTCGYSAIEKDFNKISSNQIEKINNSYDSRMIPREYPDEYTIDIAIDRYKRALIYSILKSDKISDQAYISLKIAWLYRLKESNEEVKFLTQSLNGFIKAFERESYPICGMDEYSIMFLIGELSRRVGKKDDALKWIGRVVTSPYVSSRIKELARDSKDLIES